MRLFAAVLVASGVLPVHLSGARAGAPPGVDALVLPAAGKRVATAFATERGSTYTIRVSGVYQYNGALGLGFMDCGHKDPENQGGWINVANVLLDGRVARCSLEPFSPTHSYEWTQQGTGQPFTFEIYANSYTSDDSGCLLVTVADDTPGVADVVVSRASDVRPGVPDATECAG